MPDDLASYLNAETVRCECEGGLSILAGQEPRSSNVKGDDTVRIIKSAILVLAACGGMLYSLYHLHGSPNDPGPMSVILTFCSAIFTWWNSPSFVDT